MAGGEFRVFLSAVTSEFGQARDALAKDLAARNTQVRVHDSFRAEAGANWQTRMLLRGRGARGRAQRTSGCPGARSLVYRHSPSRTSG